MVAARWITLSYSLPGARHKPKTTRSSARRTGFGWLWLWYVLEDFKKDHTDQFALFDPGTGERQLNQTFPDEEHDPTPIHFNLKAKWFRIECANGVILNPVNAPPVLMSTPDVLKVGEKGNFDLGHPGRPGLVSPSASTGILQGRFFFPSQADFDSASGAKSSGFHTSNHLTLEDLHVKTRE
ncbi:hypothetical protein B0T14DRAFT_563900 [Immersiella caudata]|uniref:Uncharacterized protein n=1 Tax=Immersiella caudata TaxID=314043 RepID=A0AA39WVM2_9PEZI|nr:hypothetical protein B0T14DRAFT_563900 [Immersiella caudata]